MVENSSTDERAVTESPSSTPSTDAFRITFTPERQAARRIRFEARSDANGWWRIDQEWTGCAWRTVGREPVANVVVERRVDRE